MDVRLFGVVEIVACGRTYELGPPQRCAVLAALAVDPAQHVTSETLIDRVWGEQPPASARRALHAHITRIRRTLEAATRHTEAAPVRLLRRPGGYLLDIEPHTIDVHRFEDLADRARAGGLSDSERVLLLREALSLWRGEPLAGVPGSWADRIRQTWHRRYPTVVQAWSAAELAVNNPTVVISPLSELIAEYPLSEPLVAILMRALNAVGHGSDALDLYTTTRKRLIEDLAVEPGAELRQIHHAILCNDPDDPVPVTVPPSTPSLPAQLPRNLAHFAGRHEPLALLDKALAAATNAEGAAMPILAVVGTAGVGKTSLAVFWAHRVADRFPDGQLYVNLRGFDPSGQVMDPAEAVRRFLDALGLPAERTPADLDAQAALYRSELAARRMLVVLDNARDTAQVRPLLPGALGCLVLVTSRNQLSGLVAGDCARPINLDLLNPGEANELLAYRVGVDRLASEPTAVNEIATACVGLPLALAIVAARAALKPHLPLRVLSDELRDASARLDTLTTDDPYTDLRAVFSWSYKALSPTAARLFRLLGLHHGPDICARAAASLAAIPVTAIRELLAELTRAHLLAEPSPGRYAFHDLLHAYATEQTQAHDTGEQRRNAMGRVLDYYLHTAHAAVPLLEPARDTIALASPQPGVCPEHFHCHDLARDWFTAEHVVMLAAIDYAADAGFDTHTWQLAWALWTYLDWRGHWHDLVAAQLAAVAAAERLDDLSAQASAHLYVARAYTRLGLYDDTQIHLMRALALYQKSSNHAGQAHTHHALAEVWYRQSHHNEALNHAEQALDLYRVTAHKYGQAQALNNIGWYHAELGHYTQALTFCRQALTLHQELDNHPGQANTWDSLGYANHHLGHHTEAITCYQYALHLFRDLGHRYYEADTLNHIGDTHHVTGNPGEARNAWCQALTILDEIHHPDAVQVRSKLAALDTTKLE